MKERISEIPKIALEARTEVSYIPDMDDAELLNLSREKLSRALQAIDPVKQPEMTRKLAAEVADRIIGTPIQRIRDTRKDDNDIIERAKWLIASGLATQKFIDMCKKDGIDVENIQVIENNLQE